MNVANANILQALILASLFQFAPAPTAFADLYVNYIQTVEWLVDNSDAIAVISTQERKVQFLLKGTEKQITGTLTPAKSHGHPYFSLTADGNSRLLFVRGRELLHEIPVARKPIFDNKPKLSQVLYAVTQYGQILLSESELFRCIRERLDSGPGRPLAQRHKMPYRNQSGVAARNDFPLETSDQTYVLIVPMTVERRDHFIQELRTGDVLTRIQAISELSQFQDSTARNAIREVTKPQEVTPSIYHRKHYGTLTTLTSSTVVATAKNALKD